jgi:hypothetical protein
MDLMTVFAIIIVGLILCILLIILLPNKKLTWKKDIYPRLDLFTQDFEGINRDVCEDEVLKFDSWVTWPGKKWKPKGSEGIMECAPFFTYGKVWKENINNLSSVFAGVRKMGKVQFAGLIKVKAESSTKLTHGWKYQSNSSLRCIFPLVCDECSLIIEDEKHDLTLDWLVYDHSRETAFSNKSDDDAIFLVLEIKRPSSIPIGISEFTENIDVFVTKQELTKSNQKYSDSKQNKESV